MGSFGNKLRREREMRGITLDEIAEATKIGTRALRALEEEQFDALPGGIFNKGFVRAYARFLGIDEEQAVADYLSANNDGEQSTPHTTPDKPILIVEDLPSKESTSSGLPWRTMGAVLLLAVLAAAGWYFYNKRREQQEAAAVTTSEPQPAPVAQPTTPPAPAATTDTSAATPPATSTATNLPTATKTNTTSGTSSKPSSSTSSKPPSGTSPELTSATTPRNLTNADTQKGFILHIRAVQDSWMKITADDKLIIDGEILKASQERNIRARKKVVMTIGNAGGIEISHNGKMLASLGPENKSRTVTFTPEGIQP